MPSTWENRMIEQGFNSADSTIKEMISFFETRVEYLEPKEDKKKSSAAAKKKQQEKRKEAQTRRHRLQYCRVQ